MIVPATATENAQIAEWPGFSSRSQPALSRKFSQLTGVFPNKNLLSSG
jgi:hypothetical protein